jgi:hypothetical protein
MDFTKQRRPGEDGATLNSWRDAVFGCRCVALYHCQGAPPRDGQHKGFADNLSLAIDFLLALIALGSIGPELADNHEGSDGLIISLSLLLRRQSLAASAHRYCAGAINKGRKRTRIVIIQQYHQCRLGVKCECENGHHRVAGLAHRPRLNNHYSHRRSGSGPTPGKTISWTNGTSFNDNGHG